MIISVDTGNKHMKTENCEFNSGVEILDTLPGDMEEVIEYEGKYYVTTNRRISYMEDKIADERYFILQKSYLIEKKTKAYFHKIYRRLSFW